MAVSPLQIWQALLSAGASSVQAAGIMGNMIAESSLSPEAVNPADSNGYASYGLCQWNAGSYPNASSLVTGNPAADLAAQVNFLATTGGLGAASGSTVQETAGNFAATYERCGGCQPGGSQYDQRVSNAEQVAGWASSGNWPAGSSQGAITAQLTSAELTAAEQEASDCLWGINYGQVSGGGLLGGITSDILGSIGLSGEVCIFTKSEMRAIIGAGLLMAGLSVMSMGMLLLALTAGLDIAAPIITGMARPAELAARAAGIPERYRAVGRPQRQRAQQQQQSAQRTAQRERERQQDRAERASLRQSREARAQAREARAQARAQAQQNA